MNNELNHSNENLVNLKFADFNKTVIMSYNNRLLKFLSDIIVISFWNLTTLDLFCWNLDKDISKLVRNFFLTRDLEGMLNDLKVISIPKEASKSYFTNPLRRPCYET